MNSPRPALTDQQLRRAWEAGELKHAAELAIRAYGPEILGYLSGRLRDRNAALESYAQGQEDFVRGWPAFRWDCPVRNWMYKVFSNAANRWCRDRHNRQKLRVGLSSLDPAEHARDLRRSTAPYLKTTVKSRYRLLLERLSEEERSLLILKVDKGFSWREVAELMRPDAALSEREWKREGDRRAQQFKRLKQKLRDQLFE